MSEVVQMDNVTSKTDEQVIKINILKIMFRIIGFHVSYTVLALLVLDHCFLDAAVHLKLVMYFVL